MLAQALRRVNIPRNPGLLGLGAVAAKPAMVLLVRVTCARVGACRKLGVPLAWFGAGGKAGFMIVWDGTGGNVGVPCILVPVYPTWHACVGACLSGTAGLVLFWDSHCSLFTWTFKRVIDNARALMLSRI